MNKGIARSTLHVTFFSIVTILLNLISQLIIANYFGAKFNRDAYLVAISIPLFVTTVINGSLGYIFIPQLIDIREKESQISVQQFLFSTFIFLTFLLSSILFIIFFFNKNIIHLLFPNYNYTEIEQISHLLIILLPSIIFNVFSTFLNSLYQVEGKFVIPALSNILSISINISLFLILYKKYDINGLAIAYLTGSFISCIFQLPILSNFHFNFKSGLNKKALISFIKISLPLLIGGLFFRFTNVFEKIIASNLSKGSISYLGYSSQIITVLGTITSNGVSIVIFPLLSKYWSNNNKEIVGYYIQKSLRIILLLTIPISIYLIFFGNFIISQTFQRGEFTSETSLFVSLALKYSLGAFVFQSIGSIIVKLFYISGNTKINTIISSLELILYICTAYFLVDKLSFIALPVALTISSLLSIIASFIFLNKKIISIKYLNIVKDFILITSLSCFSILLMFFINKNFVLLNILTTMIISTIICCLFFIKVGSVFKIEELMWIEKYCIQKLKKN